MSAETASRGYDPAADVTSLGDQSRIDSGDSCDVRLFLWRAGAVSIGWDFRDRYIGEDGGYKWAGEITFDLSSHDSFFVSELSMVFLSLRTHVKKRNPLSPSKSPVFAKLWAYHHR